ncbi:MAG: YcaO-like family protein [Gemmatimonadota bacterium]
MLQRPAFGADVGWLAQPGVGVVVVTARDECVVPGPLPARLARLLNGCRTADHLVALLPEFPASHVYYTLLQWEGAGWLREGRPARPPRIMQRRHRAFLDERRLVHPARGVTPWLVSLERRPDDPVHVAVAGPVLMPAPTVRGLERIVAQRNVGKAWSRRAARRAALAEAVERWSAVFRGRERRRRSSRRALGHAALDPRAFHLGHAGRGLAPDAVLDWTRLYPLAEGEPRWLPSALIYFGHPEASRVGAADSNGNAAGRTRTDAIVRALLEVIERDAVAIWWYNRLSRPPIDLAAAFATRGRRVWALDLTTDLGVPVVAAISARMRGAPRISLGFGAGTDTGIALHHALLEVVQTSRASDLPEAKHSRLWATFPELAEWLTAAAPADHPYLLPGDEAPRAPVVPPPTGHSPRARLRWLLARLRDAGLSAYQVNLTRGRTRVPVVKAIVPGLRPAWPRLAPGRLYDVPVRLGWLPRARDRGSLNPVPFVW